MNNNLYTPLHGGLGNRLFILASTYGICKKNNYNLILFEDSPNNHSNIKYWDNIFKTFPIIKKQITTSIKINTKVIKEGIDCFKYNEYNLTNDVILIGYFQNIKYFTEYSNEIINYFTVDEIIDSLKLKYTNLDDSYFIHYRRGDYINNELYNVINYDVYFKNSIKFIKNLDSSPNFYILSDDIKYCKEYFKNIINEDNNINIIFIENLNEVESLHLISLCKKGGICTNSSFSWWGSYLNKNPEKVVVFPKKWINRDWDYLNGLYYPGVKYIDCNQILDFTIKNKKINNQNTNYLVVVIYSCLKRLIYAEEVYSKINNNINAKVLIMYGDNTLSKYVIKNDKYLILPVDDNYESLTFKSIELFKSIYSENFKGCFKMDDDINVNINHLNNIIDTLDDSIDYLGTKCTYTHNNITSTHHYNKCSTILYNKPCRVFKTDYCAGPLYYLSKKAMSFFKDNVISTNLFEDNTIGYHLTNNGINCTHLQLYLDIKNNINNKNNISIHNTIKPAISIHNTIEPEISIHNTIEPEISKNEEPAISKKYCLKFIKK